MTDERSSPNTSRSFTSRMITNLKLTLSERAWSCAVCNPRAQSHKLHKFSHIYATATKDSTRKEARFAKMLSYARMYSG